MSFRIPLRAPEGSENGSGTNAVPAVASETPASNATPPGGELAKIIADAVNQGLSSFRSEFVDFRRETRNKFAATPAAATPATSTPAAASATAAAPQWDPAAILAFRDAIEEAGVTVSVPQRKILEKLYRAESGIADPVSWVREQSDAFGWRKPAAPAPAAASAAQPAAVKPPDTPAPAGTAVSGNQLPADPALLPQSVIDAMTPEEAKAHYERWQNRNGTFQHPWRTAREAERNARAESDRASAAVRRLINGGK